jgi:hypothetical protein
MRKRAVETIGASRATSNAEDGSPAGESAKVDSRAQSPWPFNLDDMTPLEWWRTMPADHLNDAQLLYLRTTMKKISMLKSRQWLSALEGDAAASVAIAIKAMPIDRITLEIDLAMSALALCALDGSAGAALVLAHILRHTALDHPFDKELSVSWLALNLRRALNAKKHLMKPRLRSKTSKARPRQQAYLYGRVPA